MRAHNLFAYSVLGHDRWAEQGLTQTDYEAKFAAADRRYAAMLSALVDGLRTGK